MQYTFPCHPLENMHIFSVIHSNISSFILLVLVFCRSSNRLTGSHQLSSETDKCVTYQQSHYMSSGIVHIALSVLLNVFLVPIFPL